LVLKKLAKSKESQILDKTIEKLLKAYPWLGTIDDFKTSAIREKLRDLVTHGITVSAYFQV
jgi:hypothetical protein